MAGLSRLMLSTKVKTRKRQPSYKTRAHEVHTPLLIGRLWGHRNGSRRAHLLLPRFEPKGEPFQAVQNGRLVYGSRTSLRAVARYAPADSRSAPAPRQSRGCAGAVLSGLWPACGTDSSSVD